MEEKEEEEEEEEVCVGRLKAGEKEGYERGGIDSHYRGFWSVWSCFSVALVS